MVLDIILIIITLTICYDMLFNSNVGNLKRKYNELKEDYAKLRTQYEEYNSLKKPEKDVVINVFRKSEDAVIPTVAYNGSSAAFDLTCTQTTLIKAKSSAIIPNDLRLSIDQSDPYFMFIQLRSSMGFKKDLVPHTGVVDAGYTGDLGVKVYNLGDTDIVIEKGSKYAQVLVLKKPVYKFKELNEIEFTEYTERQSRGDKGFGSSGK